MFRNVILSNFQVKFFINDLKKCCKLVNFCPIVMSFGLFFSSSLGCYKNVILKQVFNGLMTYFYPQGHVNVISKSYKIIRKKSLFKNGYIHAFCVVLYKSVKAIVQPCPIFLTLTLSPCFYQIQIQI